MFSLSLHLLALSIGIVHCRDLSVPSTWREPQNKYTLVERTAASQNAIDSLLPGLNETIGYFNDLSYWQTANVLSAMANQDYVTHESSNQAKVTAYLNRAFSLYPNYSTLYNDDALWWATAAYYAYRAYGNENLLNHAIQTWEYIKTLCISEDDVPKGRSTKRFPIMGRTMTGGVLSEDDAEKGWPTKRSPVMESSEGNIVAGGTLSEDDEQTGQWSRRRSPIMVSSEDSTIDGGVLSEYDAQKGWPTKRFPIMGSYDDIAMAECVLSEYDAKSGWPTSFPIMGSCEGKTMAGGVFWRPVPDDTAVNSVTTTLSAYLAELTHNSTYTDAAIAAATWMQTLNVNNDSLALDTIYANDCSRSPATVLFTYNSGKLIEGLSVLSDVTGDERWKDLMLDTATAAFHTTAWQDANGVITEGGATEEDDDIVGFKSILIRALHEAWVRNPDNAELQTIIRSYVNVQYNALMELASTPYDDTRWYSAAWAGSQPSMFTSWGQLAALDVLVSGVDVNPAI